MCLSSVRFTAGYLQQPWFETRENSELPGRQQFLNEFQTSFVFSGALHRRQGDFNAAIDDYLLAMDKTDHDEFNTTYKEAQRQLLLCYNDFAVECFR